MILRSNLLSKIAGVKHGFSTRLADVGRDGPRRLLRGVICPGLDDGAGRRAP